MKKIILALCVLKCSFLFPQKYALIDRGWERPVRYTDSINKADLKGGWYPVVFNQMDSLVLTVEKFRRIFKSGLKRTSFDMTEFETSSIEFEISNVHFAYGDRYDINMISNTGESKVSMKLSNSSIPNRDNQQLIKRFYSYLKKYVK